MKRSWQILWRLCIKLAVLSLACLGTISAGFFAIFAILIFPEVFHNMMNNPTGILFVLFCFALVLVSVRLVVYACRGLALRISWVNLIQNLKKWTVQIKWLLRPEALKSGSWKTLSVLVMIPTLVWTLALGPLSPWQVVLVDHSSSREFEYPGSLGRSALFLDYYWSEKKLPSRLASRSC